MMASVVVRGNRKKSLTLRGVDPETCMIVFKNHWAQVVKILEKHEPGRGSTGALGFLSGHSSSGASRLGPIPADEASAVQNYVEHMLFLLMEEEAGQGGAMGPILELVVLEGVMERLFLWSLRRQFTEDMKLEQLRMYQMLLSQARQPLLHHKPVLRPLMMLLASCAGASCQTAGILLTFYGGGVVEAELVLLLNQLCAALVKDPSVLELFFHTSEDQGAANFLLFSLLIPFTHRQGSVGQQARDSLLLIMSLSASEPRVAQHIAQNTYFCPVKTRCDRYESFPAQRSGSSHSGQVQVIQTGWFWSCVCTLTSCFLSYHLWWVCQLTVEEVMTTTAYLDLFLRSVSEPALLQTFLSFILLHRHDNVHILDTLVSRVNTPFQLGTVSLALFRTLIGLFCEDVMLQLVFRYLLPCSHLSRRQRCSLQQTDCYSCSASSLLLLLPSWCPLHLRSGSQSEHIHWPRAPGECSDSIATDRFTVSPAPPPLPPRHIQEMRRSATRLVHGAYVEESEFQDDVLVYDLIAQKDTKAAILERIMVANRRFRGSISKGPRLATNALPNGHVESESRDLTLSNAKCPSLPDNRATSSSDLLSQYHELMLSLGVEPDCDDITDDISTFRKRVRSKHCSLDSHSPVLSHHASGPFISVLLSRLENLLENSIAVNLLVTGILAQLASYPQPLLRSFLLCTDQHQQPNVRTLHQVLESVHAQVERYVAARPDYPALLTQAWRFLLAKDQDGKFRATQRRAKSRVFAIVLFAEFLKELAAIAQEHSIAPDWSAEE
uniref:Protein FAM160A1-like n=1 Tax=Stegastes partitus TaxID=144197 RepID=A0A3B5AED2_9TELE